MNSDLFDDADQRVLAEQLSPGLVLLRRFACAGSTQIIDSIGQVLQQAPLQQLFTPGGKAMSVTTSSCGKTGWLSDRKGYRYSATDLLGKAWPAMPLALSDLATAAADVAGFGGFYPDTCLINHYGCGAGMSLHQDKDESDFSQPIVSLSLGLPAIFLWGGLQRGDRALRLELIHGDVLVWGREDRLRFHGILPLAEGHHPLLGRCRINLTFRKAL